MSTQFVISTVALSTDKLDWSLTNIKLLLTLTNPFPSNPSPKDPVAFLIKSPPCIFEEYP